MSGKAGMSCGGEEVGARGGVVGGGQHWGGQASRFGVDEMLGIMGWDEAALLGAEGKTASSVFSHLAADDGADAPACRSNTPKIVRTASISSQTSKRMPENGGVASKQFFTSFSLLFPLNFLLSRRILWAFACGCREGSGGLFCRMREIICMTYASCEPPSLLFENTNLQQDPIQQPNP
jgi:hypothetical protein